MVEASRVNIFVQNTIRESENLRIKHHTQKEDIRDKSIQPRSTQGVEISTFIVWHPA